MTLVPKVMKMLKEQDAGDVIVCVGGTIPGEDIAPLKELGVAEIFTPGAPTGEIVELARNAENAWALILPSEAAAEQGASEAAASQLTTIRINDRLPNINPKDVGLDVPAYTLSVKFTNGVERIAEIGVITPTESGYYVSMNGKIVIVSRSAIDALIGLLENPPYAETQTPPPPTP